MDLQITKDTPVLYATKDLILIALGCRAHTLGALEYIKLKTAAKTPADPSLSDMNKFIKGLNKQLKKAIGDLEEARESASYRSQDCCTWNPYFPPQRTDAPSDHHAWYANDRAKCAWNATLADVMQKYQLPEMMNANKRPITERIPLFSRILQNA